MDPDSAAVMAATATVVSTVLMAPGSRYDMESMRTLIMGVRRALTDPLEEPTPEPVELVPAVPIRQSIKPDYIVCLEDGKKFKSLKRHLRTVYNLTPEDYRAKWGLPADYPMVAPNYSAIRAQLAKASGLGTKK